MRSKSLDQNRSSSRSNLGRKGSKGNYTSVDRQTSSSKVFADLNLSHFFGKPKVMYLPGFRKSAKNANCSSNDDVMKSPRPPPVMITINVSGRKFQIELGRLKKYPTTLLGSVELEEYYDKTHNEYFFDRNRDTFESIFDFYLFGKLYPPRGIPEDMYLEEVNFFRMMSIFNVDETDSDIGETKRLSKFRSVMVATNRALQEPSTSLLGKIWGWLDILFIALSAIAMIVETSESIKEAIEDETSLEYRISFAIESTTVCFFTLDVLLRFAVSDQRLAFIRSPATWLDIVTVAPYYFELFVDASRFKGLKVLRMARVVRVLKLIKKNKRLLLIAYVMSHSLGELSLLIIVWAMCITVAGCVFYYCENGRNIKIESGADALWWAVVTMSTVGYGDITPQTPAGKVFSTVFFYIGMVFLALPLTIIVGAFSKQYENKGTWSLNRQENKFNRLYHNSNKDGKEGKDGSTAGDK